MANAAGAPTEPKPKPHTAGSTFTSQSEYRTGGLSLGHQAVLKDLGRYLRVPYASLIRSALGVPPDISRIRQRLINDGILNVGSDGRASWAWFAITPARSSVAESVAFEPLVKIISALFDQIPNCQLLASANPSATPLSKRGNTSRPDAHIVRGNPAGNEVHWFDVVVPFEFKKTQDRSSKHDNERKMIWSLHHIMREDPLRRFALGVTVEDTEMRIWYSNRAFLAVSMPVDFTTEIDDVISLFYTIGTLDQTELGWDPNIERIRVEEKTQYRFRIGNQVFTTTRPLATFGADALIGRGTRVYEARDEDGNIFAIKDSWRDEDRQPEGVILEKILADIRATVGEKEAAKAEKYLVRVHVHEDVIVSGALDKTLGLAAIEDNPFRWIAVNIDPLLSGMRHLPSTGHVPDPDRLPTELERRGVCPPSGDIPCRVHTRTVFKDVGVPLMDITHLADSLSCLFGALQALYYLHKAGWVHRDISVSNVLWVKKGGQWVGKLTDFEYAKKMGSEVLHDVRTGTMHFMAIEVEQQRYLFVPMLSSENITLDSTPDPPFRMNFLHDIESAWWATVWVLFHHTDAESPTEHADDQLAYFKQAFPHAIAHGSRRDFFTLPHVLRPAYKKLAKTYGESCTAIIKLAAILQECYRSVEESYPTLSLDEHVLEKVHQRASEAYSEAVKKILAGSDIRLRPLRDLLERKRSLDDMTIERAEKKPRAGE